MVNKKLILLGAAALLVTLAQSKAQVSQDDKEICTVASDCSGAPYAKCDTGACQHKNIYPILTSEYIGILTLPILLGLANVGGIGGGGLIIPLAIGCWGFSTTEAVAISNSTVFMGALLRYFGFSIR